MCNNTLNMTMILNDEDRVIKYVYHIGDVHIRKNADRHEEYRQVFKRLCEKISDDNDKKNSIIVCTGDIFHDGMSPESIMLAKDFFEMLSLMMDVIVFRGNHDQTSKSNSNAIDYLASNLYKLKTKNNVYLLEKSGVYMYGKNLAFGYTDVYENEVIKTDEIKNRIKIGLWHGTMNKSKLCSGESLNGKFNCEDFKGYDYVMLGDIHKFQYLNKEKTIAYCGSTIQQNHGEDRTHGYIKWDLENSESKFMNVENDYGFVTVTVKKNEIVKQDYEFTKKTYLRIKYEDSDSSKLSEIINKISKKTKILSWKYEDETIEKIFNYDGVKNGNIEKIDNDIITVERLMKYIGEKYKLDDDKKIRIEEKIKETVKTIGYDYESNKRDIKIRSLSFSNFNTYGENNNIDFDEMKGIINICGKNAIGKSSIIMCVCYAIWGYAEDGNIGKYDYVNTSTKSMETKIILSINGNEYMIARKGFFKDIKKNTGNFEHSVVIYKDGKDISGKSVKDVENQIIEIIGEQSEFKKLCIMDQKKNESFLDMSDIEKTKKICNLLKLDIYTIIQNTLSQEELVNNKRIKESEKKIYIERGDKRIEKGEIIKEEIENMENEYKKIEEEKKNTENEKIKMEKEKMCLEINIDEMKKEKYELLEKENSVKRSIETYEKKIDSILKEIKEKEREKEIFGKEKKSKKYKDIEKKNNNFNEKKEVLILEKESKIKELLKGYTKMDENELNIKELNKKREMIESDNEKIKMEKEELDKKIKKINEEILKYEKDEKKNKKEHDKYKEYVEKMNVLNVTEKNIVIETENISGNIKKLQKEYKKVEDEYEKDNEILTELKKEMEKYQDIEKKKKEYESTIHEKIEKLMKERDNLLKDYENAGTIEKPDKGINKKIEEIKKEIEKNNNTINEIEHSILGHEKGIIKVTNYKDLDKKYEEYNDKKAKLEKIKDEITELNKKKEVSEIFLNLFKNHNYNEKCDVCMSNDSTKKLLKTRKEKEVIEKTIISLLDEKNIWENEIKKNEKYNKAKEDMSSNENIKKRIDELGENRKILMDKNVGLGEKIISLEKILKDYNIYLERIAHNKNVEEKIEKKKNDIDVLKKLKYEEYDKYIDTQQKILKLNDVLCELKKKMEDYEKLEAKKSDLNNSYKNILNEKDEILKKMKEKEKYSDLFNKYNENKTQQEKLWAMLEKNEISQKGAMLENELLMKKIEKYNSYVEIENKNKQIESLIIKEEEELKNIKMSEYEEYIIYKKICSDLDDCDECIKEKGEEIEKIEKELNKMKVTEREINTLIEKKKNLVKYQHDLSIVEKKLETITLKFEETKKRMDLLNNGIINNKNEMKHTTELKNEINEMKDIGGINKLIIDIIKNGFIDNLLTKSVIPPLCDNLNSVLSGYVNFGLHMEYNNKKILVYKRSIDGKYTNALKMSGYESLMSNIAFRLAINNINKLFRTDFFIIDEAFTFCDDESISKMQNLFDYMRKMYKYVIVISHNEQIKSYTDTDVVVRHIGGFSKVNFPKKKDEKDEREEFNHNVDKINHNVDESDTQIVFDGDDDENNTSEVCEFNKKDYDKTATNKKDYDETTTNKKSKKRERVDLSKMTEDEKIEHKKKMKREWEMKNKAKISEYNHTKYIERKGVTK